MRKERVGIEQVEEWLNKESGLLGVSGRSHDTRALMSGHVFKIMFDSERHAAGDHRILTARAASSAIISSESSDCNIIKPFANRVSAAVSVGEKAVLVLKARNK